MPAESHGRGVQGQVWPPNEISDKTAQTLSHGSGLESAVTTKVKDNLLN